MTEKEFEHANNALRQVGLVHGRDYRYRAPKGQSHELEFLKVPQGVGFSALALTSVYSERIAMRGYRGIIMSEAAQQTEDAYGKVLGRVARKHGWVLLAGTYEQEKGKPWLRRKLRDSLDAQDANGNLVEAEIESRGGGDPVEIGAELDAKGMLEKVEIDTYVMPSWENLILHPLGREDPYIKEREALLPRDRFLEEYGGIPARGSRMAMIYADRRQQVRDRAVPEEYGMDGFNTRDPVHLWIDLATRTLARWWWFSSRGNVRG